jgi:hypothetical protein
MASTPKPPPPPPPPPQLYHERQAFGRQLCAVHALNNALQAPKFTAADFAAVARTLNDGDGVGGATARAEATRFLGNYDVNVLQAAALQAGVDLSYFDARRAAAAAGDGDDALEALLRRQKQEERGTAAEPQRRPPPLILNQRESSWWGRLRGARHWLALVPVFEEDLCWYNVDSKLTTPERLGAPREAAAFLRARLADGATLLVARWGGAIESETK